MDALGLAISLALSSGLQILSAGNGIPAPAGARLALFCVHPQVAATGDYREVIQEQVYVVSEGNTCKFAETGSTGYLNTDQWTYGSTLGYGTTVYLG